ncbi:MAG TPA: type I glyceraldehyde-3-phosphate dehydrogenase [Myxococcota bacterium]|nr:type I glyceraldehyde-3-phosphate dehydrogenase [Myxococcota bacterium]HRY92084.1 type I glyceraldehyde-3-phosphate dehydrogenase [Myxococcota bacterium]HSA22142.1 type I glyceraldehyde-3-phosphate dehydrogenase [Myxococcota bacterium]
MAIRIGINGFGRIGRIVTRVIYQRGLAGKYEVVHINDISEPKTLAHLLKYDSVHRTFPHEVKALEKGIAVDGRTIDVSAIKDPAELPWAAKKVDIVLECTGKFLDRAGADKHMKAGAPYVFLSAPPKDKDIPAFVFGVNQAKFDRAKDKVFSNASCTTNCLAPMAKVVHETFGIEHGLMTTIHSYTNDQRVLDLEHKDLRRARAAALNMIPTTTGAAKAVGMVLPELNGKLDGFSMRVPTPNVSVVDLVAVLEKAATAEAINEALRKASEGSLKGILGFTMEPVVSSDFLGDDRSSIVDGSMTKVLHGNLAKILTWYDNEWGFSCRMLDMVGHVVG